MQRIAGVLKFTTATLAVGLLTLWVLQLDVVEHALTVLKSWGVAGIGLFALVYAFAVIVPPVPQRFLVLSAGSIYGTVLGSAAIIIGATLGATISFLVARTLLRPHLVRHKKIHNALSEFEFVTSFPSIIMVRMLLGASFDVFSYAAGVFRVSPKKFVAGTIIGMTPGTVLEVAAGEQLIKNPLIGLIVLLVLGAVTALVFYRMKSKHQAQKNAREES